MSNEIGFTGNKVNFLAQPTNSAEKLNLYEVLSKEIDTNCVKCAKPLNLDFREKLIRCPFCSDFFKPQAQLIFQVEERIQRLSNEFPVVFFMINKKIKITILVLLFLGFINYEKLVSIAFLSFIFIFIFYEFYCLRNHKVKEFKYLSDCLKQLESDYQKNK